MHPMRDVHRRMSGQIQISSQYEKTGQTNSLHQPILLSLFKRPELWACTTCSTCSLRCPAGVKNVELIMGIRNFLANQGEVPSTIRDALENTFLQGNPWGRFRDRRADWAKDLGVKILGEATTETLLYVGCAPSYDPRVQNVSTALVKIFQKADFDFGILGKKESCCGNEIRRMGEQALFKKLAKDNTNLFKKSGIKRDHHHLTSLLQRLQE